MDTHSPNSDDLNDLERRLAAWRPSPAGLDSDRLIFAAGRASAQAGMGRRAWPLVTGCLVLVTAVLGVRLGVERAERLALVESIRHQTPVPAPVPAPSPEPAPVEPSMTEPPSPDGYLAVRQRWEHDPNTLLVMAAPKRESSQGPLLANPPIPQVWQRGRVLDP